jgi:hypothetical protein
MFVPTCESDDGRFLARRNSFRLNAHQPNRSVQDPARAPSPSPRIGPARQSSSTLQPYTLLAAGQRVDDALQCPLSAHA